MKLNKIHFAYFIYRLESSALHVHEKNVFSNK